MIYQAHRGVSTEYPENTMPAFEAAIEQGYAYIETDPLVTRDGVTVLMHDKTLNRTCRYDDGSELGEKIYACDLTYAEALNFDAGVYFASSFKGTRIPKLAELLSFAEGKDVTVKIDNRMQNFADHELESLFSDIEGSSARVGFTSSNLSFIRKVLARFADAEIHYDGLVTEEILKELKSIVGKNKLVIWLAIDSPNTSWVKIPRATDALCATVKQYGMLGLWILHEDPELVEAKRLGADIIETTGRLKPGM